MLLEFTHFIFTIIDIFITIDTTFITKHTYFIKINTNPIASVTFWHAQKLNLIFFVKSGKLLRNVTNIKSEVGLKLKMGLGETERHRKREKEKQTKTKAKE